MKRNLKQSDFLTKFKVATEVSELMTLYCSFALLLQARRTQFYCERKLPENGRLVELNFERVLFWDFYAAEF